MQICHKLFPITWEPFENVNLLYILLKMQIWNGCNVLNIAGKPIKDINVNLSFLSSRLKGVEWTLPPGLTKLFKCNFKCPLKLEKILNSFLSSGSKVVEWTPQMLTSGVTLQCILGMTILTCHFCFQLWWVCTAINFGSNLGYFLAVKQVGKVLYLCMLEFLAVKQVGKVYIYACYVSKSPPPAKCWNSDFICTVQWWLHICHKPFSH